MLEIGVRVNSDIFDRDPDWIISNKLFYSNEITPIEGVSSSTRNNLLSPREETKVMVLEL